MDREKILALWNAQGLARAARLFGISKRDLKLYGDYMGCQNLVYDFRSAGRDFILRVSYRSDRPVEQVLAELHFVNYLAENGVRVSRALPSLGGDLLEVITVEDSQFIAVSFEKARGMRVPDNQYRYREGVSIDEYCQNWGQILGQMHRLTRQYTPPKTDARRPDFQERFSEAYFRQVIPETLPVVYEKFRKLIGEMHDLPRTEDAFGLIHSDFNDGNFCVDYENGDITAFDFDDACYGWFAYELASAWEGFVGRAMFAPEPGERRERMGHFFAQVLSGYHRENTLSDFWLQKLPFFLKVVEMESLLGRLEYWQDDRSRIPQEDQEEINYLVFCVQNDIPDLGLFDPVFNPRQPFRLDHTLAGG